MASGGVAGYAEVMRILETTICDAPGASEVGTVMGALFSRWPGLLGFAVQEEGELFLTELAVHPWFDEAQRSSLCSEIAVALSELIDEEPAVRELLSGRTFARAFH
jgi:hypothetical protein